MNCKFCQRYKPVKEIKRDMHKKGIIDKKLNPTCGKKLNRKKLSYEQSE